MFHCVLLFLFFVVTNSSPISLYVVAPLPSVDCVVCLPVLTTKMKVKFFWQNSLSFIRHSGWLTGFITRSLYLWPNVLYLYNASTHMICGCTFGAWRFLADFWLIFGYVSGPMDRCARNLNGIWVYVGVSRYAKSNSVYDIFLAFR